MWPRFRTIFRRIRTLGWAGIFGLGGLLDHSALAMERRLDLQFWSADQTVLALGGLWEFFGQELLEPHDRTYPSDLLVEISQPWKNLRSLDGNASLQKASYALLVQGFKPRAKGYSIRVHPRQSMTRVIVSPKYAPEQKQLAETPVFVSLLKFLQKMNRQPVLLHFQPQSIDEVWLIIIHRWANSNDAPGSIPKLEKKL